MRKFNNKNRPSLHQLRQVWGDDLTLDVLADLWGLSPRTIRRWLQPHGGLRSVLAAIAAGDDAPLAPPDAEPGRKPASRLKPARPPPPPLLPTLPAATETALQALARRRKLPTLLLTPASASERVSELLRWASPFGPPEYLTDLKTSCLVFIAAPDAGLIEDWSPLPIPGTRLPPNVVVVTANLRYNKNTVVTAYTDPYKALYSFLEAAKRALNRP